MKQTPLWFKSFMISFLLLFSIGILFVSKVTEQNIESVKTDKPINSDYQPQPDEAANVLMMFCKKKTEVIDTFMLIRVDAYQNAVSIAQIPSETNSTVNTKTASLSDLYRYGGMETAKKGVENLFFIEINYWMRMDDAGLSDCVDYLGGVEYDVPKSMEYVEANRQTLQIEAGKQLIDGRRFCGLLREGQGTDLFCALGQQKLTAGMAKDTGKLLAKMTENADTNITAYQIAFFESGISQMMNAHDAALQTPKLEFEKYNERERVTDSCRKDFQKAFGKNDNEKIDFQK